MPPPEVATKPNGYIVNPLFDWTFFIGSPIYALILGVALSFTFFSRPVYPLNGENVSFMYIFGGSFTMAHLLLVFTRSHMNPKIFKLYPHRFIRVPIILCMAMILSSWVLVFVAVLGVWWDVYHSSLQTFGLARIYDMRKGNDPLMGRELDRWFSLIFYIGPIFAGLSLVNHFQSFEMFKPLAGDFFTVNPVKVEGIHRHLFAGSVIIAAVFTFYYLYRYAQWAKQGYRISWQKVALLVSTAFCTIYVWGFNPFGQAFFIINFFHALQYFAIVWWSEGKHLKSRWRINLLMLCAIAFSYGVWATVWGKSHIVGYSVLLTVSIMHFWYDSFIWSVRAKQIT